MGDAPSCAKTRRKAAAMNPLEAAGRISAMLEKASTPYAIIGGLAVQYWGESRTTRDVDIVVLVPDVEVDRFVESVLQEFPPRVKNASAFARENRVLLVATEDGTPIDIAFGIPGYEGIAIERATAVDIPGVGSMRLLVPEDLVIHKCVAGRPRDLEDVRLVLVRQGEHMDIDYIREWLDQFSLVIEDRDVRADFEDVLRETAEDT